MLRKPEAFLWDIREAAARVIAFRNILIHGYAVLDQTIVWSVIRDHLPQLEATVSTLLDASQMGPEKP